VRLPQALFHLPHDVVEEHALFCGLSAVAIVLCLPLSGPCGPASWYVGLRGVGGLLSTLHFAWPACLSWSDAPRQDGLDSVLEAFGASDAALLERAAAVLQQDSVYMSLAQGSDPVIDLAGHPAERGRGEKAADGPDGRVYHASPYKGTERSGNMEE
jgi:hypothetical protein